MVVTKIVSSLEKVFLDDKIEKFTALEKVSALKGERLSFQLAYGFSYDNEHSETTYLRLSVKVEGELSEYANIRHVENVAVKKPLSRHAYDAQYLRSTPGLYPDMLEELRYNNSIVTLGDVTEALWIELNIPENTDKIGKSKLAVVLFSGDREYSRSEIEIDVINAALPKDDIYLTQWFHCDCLANYYDVPAWSEKHWEIVENFARTAVKNGINLLLTPVFTPSLDTSVGGERTTVQLVGVKVKNGKYSFDYKLLDRWIEMCNRVGIKYFEITHFFTQWGAKHAPKVMATVDGEYKRIFGWETEATSEEYSGFIRTFLKSFLRHMKKRGDDKRCFFHISDEPQLEHLASYKAARDVVDDLLKGYTIMDALSNYDFWTQGVCQTPIPASNHIKPFIEGNVPNLWVYYCCGQSVDVSNRFIAMPGWRTRSIGMQMYKFDIVGFLQWGFNFYNNCGSDSLINPYTNQSGDGWVPAGDMFSVYPAVGGKALESMRITVFHEALQDRKAMKLCEKLYSKEEVVAKIEEILGDTLAFDRCSYSSENMMAIREAINEMIKKAVK